MGDQQTGWQVTYNVHWQARDKAGKSYDMNVHQVMNVIRYGDNFKINHLRATVVK